MNYRDWHVVYTRPHREKIVHEQLGSWYSIEAWHPTKKEQRRWSDRVKILEVPLFRGYVFVRPLNEEQRIQVLTLDGVLTYVKYLKKPAVIKENDIAALKMFIEEHTNIHLEKLEPEKNIVIQHGPLRGLEGIVKEILRDKVILELPQLGCRLVATLQSLLAC